MQGGYPLQSGALEIEDPSSRKSEVWGGLDKMALALQLLKSQSNKQVNAKWSPARALVDDESLTYHGSQYAHTVARFTAIIR